jgi:exonuclease SbcD
MLQYAHDIMIKLLHFSDLHLGVESYGRLDPTTGLSTRLGDFLRSLDSVVDYALDENVDLVVFCGDAYQTVHPSPTNQREFARRIRRLSEANIPVFLLVGNHDMPLSTGKAASTEIFGTLEVPNVLVADTVGTHHIDTKGGRLQIVALPWPIRSHFLAKTQLRGSTTEQINDQLAEAVTALVNKEIESLDPGLPAVLAAHITVFGAETPYGTGTSVFRGQDVIIPQSLLASSAFDYVALGHLHRHQIVRKAHPPAVYSGSIERLDFGEEGERKGFVLVQLDKGATQFEFVPLQVRDFLTIEVKPRGQDPTADVLESIAAHDISDKVVRLIVHMTPEQEPLLRDNEVLRTLAGAFHVAAMIKDVERPVRLRIGGRNYEEMTTRQILETYLRAQQVPQERAELLLRHAEELLADLD